MPRECRGLIISETVNQQQMMNRRYFNSQLILSKTTLWKNDNRTVAVRVLTFAFDLNVNSSRAVWLTIFNSLAVVISSFSKPFNSQLIYLLFSTPHCQQASTSDICKHHAYRPYFARVFLRSPIFAAQTTVSDRLFLPVSFFATHTVNRIVNGRRDACV